MLHPAPTNPEQDLLTAMDILEELRQAQLQNQIEAIKKVNFVSYVLGADRARQELLPFLSMLLQSQDELQIPICEALLGMINAIGGPQHAFSLILVYEHAC